MSCIPMPQKWPVGWSDCLSILTVLNACNASVEPSASHELRLFIICYPPNFAQNLGVTLLYIAATYEWFRVRYSIGHLLAWPRFLTRAASRTGRTESRQGRRSTKRVARGRQPNALPISLFPCT